MLSFFWYDLTHVNNLFIEGRFLKDYLICISDLIHSLQGERGFSTLFIREKDNGDATELKSYFKNTNNSAEEAKDIFSQLKKQGELDTEQLELIANISFNLSKLTAKRKATTTDQISTAEIFDFYTFSLITPLIQLASSFALKIKNIHPNAISAFVFFIQWKEKVGLERLILLRGFIKHDFDDNEYQERIEFLFNEQNYYKKSFISLATIEQQEIVKSIYDIPDFEILNQIRKQLSQKNVSDIISKIQVNDWFDLISKKLNVMHTVEYELILNLDKKHSLFVTDSIKDLDVEQRLVYKLPIFDNIPAYEINKIVNSGDIYQVPKNKLIVAENSIATHLHIILIGWVKVFKNTNNKETILHMLNNNNSIMESCIFSNTCLKASAKSVSDVLLFSIPVDVVKQQIKINNQFALNLLSSVSNKTIALSHEIELIKTQTVDYRIGYYLLKIINQKKWLSTHITLPYNKATIASQLGMSREVLSRSLSSLNGQGFLVEKNSITLPNKTALCKFCDASMAEHCHNYSSDECINKDSYFRKTTVN